MDCKKQGRKDKKGYNPVSALHRGALLQGTNALADAIAAVDTVQRMEELVWIYFDHKKLNIIWVFFLYHCLHV